MKEWRLTKKSWIGWRFMALALLLSGCWAAVYSTRASAQADSKYVVDVPEGMVFVDEGYSTLGAQENDFAAASDAKPIHVVHLKAFYVDVLEVTNRDYAKCVAAGSCKEPGANESATRSYYYSYEGYGRFPVVNVTWDDAKNYCEFVGKRLLTEAEWEKMAMGTVEYRRYPWGNSDPKPYFLNMSSVPGDTVMGNSYPRGASSYGVVDTVGNVSEWVADWYSADAYRQSETENPTGPSTGTERVVRGDSWNTPVAKVHVTNRYALAPDQYNNETGIRCGKDVRESVSYNLEETPEAEAPLKQAVITAGQKDGMFILSEPGTGKELKCVVKSGVVVTVLEGPEELAYTKWYRVRTASGCEGWTLASSLDIQE